MFEQSNNRWKNKNKVKGKTSAVLGNLKPETKYQLRMYSTNENGRGPKYSEIIVVETIGKFISFFD